MLGAEASLGATADGRCLTISRAQPQDAAAWDRLVDRHPEGRFCHLWSYKQVLEKAYGYKCVYLKIISERVQVGVFPSIVVNRGSRRLVSQPFNEYGGPLIQNLSAGEYTHLAQLLLRVAEEESCGSVEIRGGIGCEPLEQTGFCIKHPLHSYAILTLHETEYLWRRSLTNEARKGVNRAQKAGLVAEIRRGPRAVEDPFYGLYLVSMKRLGVPPHSNHFFAELAAGLGDRLVAAWVMKNADPVAVLLGAITGERVQVFVTASHPQAWSMRPNDLAHWKLVQWSVAAGLRVFDFGSARYPGQIQFKRKWGVSVHEYSYYLIGPPNSAVTSRIQTAQSSSNVMAAASWVWRWVVPLRLTRIIGPPIRKYLTK